MKRFCLCAPLLLFPAMLIAVGDTVGITISSPELLAPIEIREGAGTFQVWAGPATSSNQAQSLIVNWADGAIEPPRNEPVYRVSFETTRRNPSTYVVFYTIDPSTGKGYVYIPGKEHPAYRDNTWLIVHGVEGKWFRAWSEWEKLAHPLIEKASRIR